jgi:hypothetical protein
MNQNMVMTQNGMTYAPLQNVPFMMPQQQQMQMPMQMMGMNIFGMN